MTKEDVINAIEQGKCLYLQRTPDKYEKIHYEKYNYWFDKKKMYVQKNRILRQVEFDKILISDEPISQEVFGVEEKVAKRKVYNKRYRDMLKEIEILEKALELACKNLQDINFKLYNNEVDFVNYFKEKATEKIKSE